MGTVKLKKVQPCKLIINDMGIRMGIGKKPSGISIITVLVYVSSGFIIYRKGYRLGKYVIDKSIDGGLTWELDLIQLEFDETLLWIYIDGGIAGYRQVVRLGILCIDNELTPLGFAGAENSDWENVLNTS